MARPERGALHCPECGFVNAEGANYCQKCGAFLGPELRGRESAPGETTVAYQLDESGEVHPVDLERVGAEGGTLVIRSGGGRSGEAFELGGEQTRVGRSPDADVFLDDVTVSRNHALLVRRRDGIYIDDLGSLNGTYINRRRIESHKLADGDELQIGKYKLTYLER
ncbi:MAG: FHA domain-containing protein [Actinomycetota bacterium]|nr:FHA domain-containing protein [Actinomycetota bacterium]